MNIHDYFWIDNKNPNMLTDDLKRINKISDKVIDIFNLMDVIIFPLDSCKNIYENLLKNGINNNLLDKFCTINHNDIYYQNSIHYFLINL